MKKNFFKISLVLNIVFALLSAGVWIFYNYYATTYQGDSFLAFISYTRLFFDLLAQFIGYSTILFAFSKLDFKNGLISIGTFSVSVAISMVVQVISECSMLESALSLRTVIASIYLAAGTCAINQLAPAILLAALTVKLTKNCKNPMITKFISWSNPVQKTMMIACIVLCSVNVLAITSLDLFPFLIQNEFKFFKEDLVSVIKVYVTDYIITIIFYLVLQYVVYYWMYKFYCNYIKSHPERN